MPEYIGRFAPSPTGPLHAGSLLAALASWLDARAHGGTWLVRIEDVDTPRCLPGGGEFILQQLAACGLHPDEPPVWQSQRSDLYRAALDQLIDADSAYPCACSRKDIADALTALGTGKPRHGELVYPGTCRDGLQGRSGRAWRFRTEGGKNASNRHLAQMVPAQVATKTIAKHSQHLAHSDHGDHGGNWGWCDRRLGAQTQHLAAEVGDFVLLRADGLWAYQLAVVVDDAAQGITHIVRGEDLADNTVRQLALQTALGVPAPRYLHTPLVLGANGEKLSKQNGAAALDLRHPLAALTHAALALGLRGAPPEGDIATALTRWTAEWAARWTVPPQTTRPSSL